MQSIRKWIIIISLGVIPFFSYSQNSTTSQRLEKNKEIVIAMNDLFNNNNPEEAMKFFSDSLVKMGNIGGKSIFLAMHDDIQQTFPDIQTKIVTLWAADDWVIADCIFSGTHKGVATLPHHGGLLVAKPATNRSFHVQHIRMYRIRNGKIVERKAVRDDIGMCQQLGLIPPQYRATTTASKN